MKRRFADQRQNKDIIDKKIKTIFIDNNDFRGYVSLLNIIKVSNKCCVDVENRCILDDNYFWVEIYPLDKNYCITAMYNDNGKIVEWYFDIVLNNGFEEGVPYEDDLYLDVVIVPDGRIHILDEEELLDALNDGEINKKQYELAYKIKDEILTEYKDINKLVDFTNKLKEKVLD